jgi:hypothetical protein
MSDFMGRGWGNQNNEMDYQDIDDEMQEAIRMSLQDSNNNN